MLALFPESFFFLWASHRCTTFTDVYMMISGVEKDFVPKNNPNTSVIVGNSHSSHERHLGTESYLETRRRVTQLAGYVQQKSV